MNLDPLVRWARRVLTLLEQPNTVPTYGIDPAGLEQQLGGLRWFGQQHLEEWEQLWTLCRVTEHFVRHQGLTAGCQHQLAAQLPVTLVNQRTQKVRDELVAFVAHHSAQAHSDERLCGSSEIIESVFGQFKRLQGE